MLYLDYEFYNAKTVVTGGQTHIVAADTAKPVYMIVLFPPQQHGEESFTYETAGAPYPAPPLSDALAGPSWLAFEVPAHRSIPFTAAGLLDWTGLTPRLVPVVSDPGNGKPAAPDALHSALEVPWSLWLSPPADGTWHHSPAPVTSDGRTELWHTRLGTPNAEPPGVTPMLKAFWTYGYSQGPGTPPADPWQMSLSPAAREQIVTFSATPSAGGGPVTASLLALSALGASLDVQGTWSPGASSTPVLTQWLHRTSAGRESYVRAAKPGYLFPFGHRAVYAEVADREFQTDPAGNTVAFLVQRQYVAVTQPVITYTGDGNEPFGGRANPMRTVTVKTVVSPSLTFDPMAPIPGLSVTDAFWVRSDVQDVPFSFVATDAEGRTADFTTSVIWLDQDVADAEHIGIIVADYNGQDTYRNSPSLGGALFAFAHTDGAAPGSTAHYVEAFTLTAKYAPNGAASFYPLLQGADPTVPASTVSGAVIHLPGAEQLTGGALSAPNVTISPNYVTSGFVAGVAEVYLTVAGNAPGLSFPVSLVGGMAAPNFSMSGIARDLGPVAGALSDILDGTFDPAKYFGSLPGGIGKLLGAIPITEIIAAIGPGAAATGVHGTGATAGAQVPKITSTWVYPGNNASKPPKALRTKLTWNPAVQGDPAGFFQPGNGANLLITAEIYTPVADPAKATYSIHGELTNFTLVLFGTVAEFIDVGFSSFTFDAKTGAKPSVRPQISTVTFSGPLSFISDFEQLLESLDGPAIDVTAAGIGASYSLGLPDVSVGAFALSNLSLDAGVNIPFDGSPVRARFALCSQDNPFQLSIASFGGGGFFSLAIGADGIEQLQVALEFGASVSVDLGVASGGVSIMGGVYFALQTTPARQVTLTGYLRADGNLSVLGIITISMEFYLGLTYLAPGQAYGEASVTVSVCVLFFSKSVTVTYKKTIGGGSDPSFAQAIAKADWTKYCKAFA